MATQERNCRFYAIVRGRKVGIVACSGASAVTDVDPFVSNFPRGLVKHFRTWEEAQNFLDGENTPVKFRISTPGLKYPITKEVSVPCTEPVGDVLDRILAEGELGGRPTNGFEISLPSGEGSAITLETAAGAIPGRTPVVNVQMLENQTESKKHKRTSWTLQILGLPSSSLGMLSTTPGRNHWKGELEAFLGSYGKKPHVKLDLQKNMGVATFGSAGSLKHTWEALQAAQQLKEWEHNGHKGHFRFELSEDISRKLVNVKPAQIGECMGEATGTEGSEEPEGHRATKKVCMEAGASQGDADALMETEVPAGESPVQRVRITGPCFFTSRASPGSSTRVTHVPTSSSRFGEASSLLATQRRQETLSTVNALGGRNGALKPPQLR